jgi:hypothetical protein
MVCLLDRSLRFYYKFVSRLVDLVRASGSVGFSFSFIAFHLCFTTFVISYSLRGSSVLELFTLALFWLSHWSPWVFVPSEMFCISTILTEPLVS